MPDEAHNGSAPDSRAEAIRTWRQHLAAISGECASAFDAASAPIARRLEAASFARWAAQGLALAQGGWRGRECATWYFKLSASLLARLPLEELVRLAEAMRRALAVSPQVSLELLRGAARFVERDRPITVADWVAAGERLSRIGRSGRLAAAYFEVSPEVLSLTGPHEFGEWLELVQTVAGAAETTALEVMRHSVQRLEPIPPAARLKALRLARLIARQTPTATNDLLRTLAGSLHAVRAAWHDRWLDLVLRAAGAGPQHVDRLLKAASHLLPGLSEAEQELLLAQLWGVTLADVEAGALLGEHLPDVLRHLAAQDVEAWVAPGLAVLGENRDSGLAYFALESQACQAQLAALSRIVHLRDVQGVLRLYAAALAGKALSVRPLAELPAAFQSRRQFPTTDGETVYLPPSVERFPTPRENFQLYLVMTAHQAGYLEFGTFAFALDELTRRLGPASKLQGAKASPLGSSAPALAWRSDFERFFAGFPRPSVARDLFYCLEDGRIDYRLRRAYRGLAPHIERAIQEGLAARPPIAGRSLWEALFEVLMHLCNAGTPPGGLPRLLVPLARFLQGVVGHIRRPQATVYDAAAGAIDVYRLLERLPNVRLGALDDAAAEGEVVALAEALSGEAALAAFQQMMPALPAGEEVAYRSPDPLPHQGECQPEVVQRKLQLKELSATLERLSQAATPIPPELLRQLLEHGVDIDIRGSGADELDDTSGLFISDLEGKGPVNRVEPARTPTAAEPDRLRDRVHEELQNFQGGEAIYCYDEWDYLLRDYRVRWCLLREKPLEGDDEGFVAKVLQEDAALIGGIRRQFQLLKPELFKKLKRRDHGEEIDLDAAIEGVVDRRVTGVPPERVYIKRDKREREVSTVFLLDLSASTDDPIEPPSAVGPAATRHASYALRSGAAPLFAAERQRPPTKRIIDVEREALVVMAEALESIGDEYAIYGFSGYGRDNVEFFVVKEVEERYSEAVKRRIDAMKPQRSTRMGPAIRHAVYKLQRRAARLKTLILLSDGYPQDFDYGKDRRGKDYGIQDTKVALQEARRHGIHTFCITVDREGKSYLPEMCGEEHFIVIENVARLPQLLPKIYRGLTT